MPDINLVPKSKVIFSDELLLPNQFKGTMVIFIHIKIINDISSIKIRSGWKSISIAVFTIPFVFMTV
jgi:hypothetical protein